MILVGWLPLVWALYEDCARHSHRSLPMPPTGHEDASFPRVVDLLVVDRVLWLLRDADGYSGSGS